MSSLVMWSSSSSELFCPAQHWSSTHTCTELCFARAFHGPENCLPLIKDPAPVAHPWPLGSCCGGGVRPSSRGTSGLIGPSSHFWETRSLNKNKCLLCVYFFPFFFFLVGWCSGRIDVGDTVRDAANNQKPSEGSKSQCQRPKQQPRFRKLKYLTCLDLEPFSWHSTCSLPGGQVSAVFGEG